MPELFGYVGSKTVTVVYRCGCGLCFTDSAPLPAAGVSLSSELTSALEELKEAASNSREFNAAQRSEIFEVLDFIKDETAKPVAERRLEAIVTTCEMAGDLVAWSPSVAVAWQKHLRTLLFAVE